MWLLCGAISGFLTILTLILTLRRKNGADWTSISALSFTAITLLFLLKMDVHWVCREDWTALIDVLPTMFPYAAGFVTIQILLNALALGIRRKNELCRMIGRALAHL